MLLGRIVRAYNNIPIPILYTPILYTYNSSVCVRVNHARWI
jgi:hypothetical protein